MNSKQARDRAPGAARRPAKPESGSPAGPGMVPPWPAGPWTNPWLEFWTNWWSGWLGYGIQRSGGAEPPPAGGERRQEARMPWMPQFEKTVIPLRRRTDPPGQEAERISMRMQMPNLPWLGGENVIAFDAVVPRPRDEGAPSGAPSQPPSGANEPDTGKSS